MIRGWGEGGYQGVVVVRNVDIVMITGRRGRIQRKVAIYILNKAAMMKGHLKRHATKLAGRHRQRGGNDSNTTQKVADQSHLKTLFRSIRDFPYLAS